MEFIYCMNVKGIGDLKKRNSRTVNEFHLLSSTPRSILKLHNPFRDVSDSRCITAGWVHTIEREERFLSARSSSDRRVAPPSHLFFPSSSTSSAVLFVVFGYGNPRLSRYYLSGVWSSCHAVCQLPWSIYSTFKFNHLKSNSTDQALLTKSNYYFLALLMMF